MHSKLKKSGLQFFRNSFHKFHLFTLTPSSDVHNDRMKLALRPHDLNCAEYSALKLEGEILSGLHIDSPDTWRERSHSVLYMEHSPLVLTGLSAAWALGVGVKPTKLTASTIDFQRLRDAHNVAVNIEQRALASDHYWKENNCGVTTPLRTISDLLRSTDTPWTHSSTVVAQMVVAYGVSQSVLEQFIDSLGVTPYKHQALQRASQLTYPSETR